MVKEVTAQIFAAWIKGFRAHVDETQEQFARRVGVSRAQINRWENCRAYPTWKVRVQLNQLSKDAGYTPVPPKM